MISSNTDPSNIPWVSGSQVNRNSNQEHSLKNNPLANQRNPSNIPKQVEEDTDEFHATEDGWIADSHEVAQEASETVKDKATNDDEFHSTEDSWIADSHEVAQKASETVKDEDIFKNVTPEDSRTEENSEIPAEADGQAKAIPQTSEEQINAARNNASLKERLSSLIISVDSKDDFIGEATIEKLGPGNDASAQIQHENRSIKGPDNHSAKENALQVKQEDDFTEVHHSIKSERNSFTNQLQAARNSMKKESVELFGKGFINIGKGVVGMTAGLMLLPTIVGSPLGILTVAESLKAARKGMYEVVSGVYVQISKQDTDSNIRNLQNEINKDQFLGAQEKRNLLGQLNTTATNFTRVNLLYELRKQRPDYQTKLQAEKDPFLTQFQKDTLYNLVSDVEIVYNQAKTSSEYQQKVKKMFEAVYDDIIIDSKLTGDHKAVLLKDFPGMFPASKKFGEVNAETLSPEKVDNLKINYDTMKEIVKKEIAEKEKEGLQEKSKIPKVVKREAQKVEAQNRQAEIEKQLEKQVVDLNVRESQLKKTILASLLEIEEKLA